MPRHEVFSVPLPERQPVEIYVIELSDGRVVSRTVDELAHESDEVRLAAGLPPLAERR